MLKGFKFRIYPTEEQKIQFAKTFGCVRKVYNLKLAENQEAEKKFKEKIKSYCRENNIENYVSLVETVEKFEEENKDKKWKDIEENKKKEIKDIRKKMSVIEKEIMKKVDIKREKINKEYAKYKSENDPITGKSLSFLGDVSGQSLSAAAANLKTAYENFFARLAKGEAKGFPQFKNKFSKQSLKENLIKKIEITEKNKTYFIKVPKKIGGEIEIRFDSNKIKRDAKLNLLKNYKAKNIGITISKEPSGKYYITILIDDGMIEKSAPTTFEDDKVVGIDLGVKSDSLATFDSGEKIKNIKIDEALTRQLLFYQKKLSKIQDLAKDGKHKKLSKSKNYQKLRIRKAKIDDRIKRIREYNTHLLTTNLTKSNDKVELCEKIYKRVSGKKYNFDGIALEDLNVKKMMKSSDDPQLKEKKKKGKISRRADEETLHKSIANANFGEIKRQLEYKSKWYGKKLVLVDPAWTSQTCSNCGKKMEDEDWKKITKGNSFSLDIREWICPHCNTKHDRDINAAKNIKKLGFLKKLKEPDLKQINGAGDEA